MDEEKLKSIKAKWFVIGFGVASFLIAGLLICLTY